MEKIFGLILFICVSYGFYLNDKEPSYLIEVKYHKRMLSTDKEKYIDSGVHFFLIKNFDTIESTKNEMIYTNMALYKYFIQSLNAQPISNDGIVHNEDCCNNTMYNYYNKYTYSDSFNVKMNFLLDRFNSTLFTYKSDFYDYNISVSEINANSCSCYIYTPINEFMGLTDSTTVIVNIEEYNKVDYEDSLLIKKKLDLVLKK